MSEIPDFIKKAILNPLLKAKYLGKYEEFDIYTTEPLDNRPLCMDGPVFLCLDNKIVKKYNGLKAIAFLAKLTPLNK